MRDPVAVLADCLDREDAELAASDYRDRALANADHLGMLHARWADLAGTADRKRYHQIVMDALPDEYRRGRPRAEGHLAVAGPAGRGNGRAGCSAR